MVTVSCCRSVVWRRNGAVMIVFWEFIRFVLVAFSVADRFGIRVTTREMNVVGYVLLSKGS